MNEVIKICFCCNHEPCICLDTINSCVNSAREMLNSEERESPKDTVKHFRYWLFATTQYEAKGGLDDLESVSDDINELKEFVLNGRLYSELYEIIDTLTWTIVYSFNSYDKVWKEVSEPIAIFHKVK